MKRYFSGIIIIYFCLFASFAYSQNGPNPPQPNSSLTKSFPYYTYIDRDHSTSENMKHLAGLFGLSVALYPLTQPKTFRESGSFKAYRNNFGKIVFDQDEPFWNWFVHPLSGSQVYLYFRANGYSRVRSLLMTFVSSTLFEFGVEIYTEPASLQDLYQTPVLGSVLGFGIETLSLALLNSKTMVGKIIGHAINPATLLWFYEGKVQIVPVIQGRKGVGLSITGTF